MEIRKILDLIEAAPPQAGAVGTFGKNPNVPATSTAKPANAPPAGGTPFTNPAPDVAASSAPAAAQPAAAQPAAAQPAPQTKTYGGGYDPTKVQYAYGGKPTPTASATQSAALDTAKAGAIGGTTKTAPTASATQSAAQDVSKANAIAGSMQPAVAQPAPQPAAPPAQTSDQIATAALNAPAQNTSGTSLGRQAAFGQMAEDELEEDLEEELAEAFNDMLRLSGLTLNEKAVSKQQQKFMGMVHAMQKGEKVKGASPELKKVAKTMGKKDAKDFAKTKHKGLPQKVSEGLNLMLDEDGHTLNHIVNKYKHEVKKFLNGDMMSENLYDALYDYYLDRGDMPYGVAKAREGDPYAWTVDRFYNDITADGMNEAPVYEVAGADTLQRLAELAGLSEDGPGQFGMRQNKTMSSLSKSDIERVRAADAKMDKIKRDSWKEIHPGEPYDQPEKPSSTGLSARQGAQLRKDLIDYNKPQQPPAAPSAERKAGIRQAVTDYNKEKVKEQDLTECGDMGMDTEDRLNVSTNMSSDGTRSVNISAQGDQADALLQMLKMAGLNSSSHPAMVVVGNDDEIMDEERETEYANTPEEEYENIETQFVGGDGEVAGMEKQMHRGGSARFSDNPLAVDEMLDEELDAMLESILIRDDKDEPEIKRDPETGRVSATFPVPKRRDPASQEIPMEPESPESRVTGPRSMKVPGERTGTEGYDDETEVYEEEKPTWLQRQPSKSQEEIAKDWEARGKANPDYVPKEERPYRDPNTGKMITPPRGATNPPQDPVYPAKPIKR